MTVSVVLPPRDDEPAAMPIASALNDLLDASLLAASAARSALQSGDVAACEKADRLDSVYKVKHALFLQRVVALLEDRARLDAFESHPDASLYQTTDGKWHVEYLTPNRSFVRYAEGSTPREAIDVFRAASAPQEETNR